MAPPPAIRSLAQSTDGYLWIASSEGCFASTALPSRRMPGLRDPELGEFQPSAVHASPSGDVWIGYNLGGIARYRRGELRRMNMPNAPEYVVGIEEDGNGGLWIVSGRDSASLTHFSNGKWEEQGAAQGIPFGQVLDVDVDRHGTTWVIVAGQLHVRQRGEKRFHATGVKSALGAEVAEDARGRMWLSDVFGVRPVPDPRSGAALPLPNVQRAAAPAASDSIGMAICGSPIAPTGSCASAQPISMIRGPARTPKLSRASEGLTSDRASAVLYDREGNIWVGTEAGLDRLRTAVVRPQEGIPVVATGYAGVRDARGHRLCRP